MICKSNFAINRILSFKRTVSILAIVLVLVGCSNHSRNCVLHLIIVDENNKPVSGIKLELKTDTIVRTVEFQHLLTTAEDGTAILKYGQQWANRSKPPKVTWTHSLGNGTMTIAENNEGYFLEKKFF